MKSLILTTLVLGFGLYSFSQVTGTLNDIRDGKTYKTVKIGSQTWMAENLAYKAESGCWAYDNNPSNVTRYGFLYSYESANSVCPSGWHLPSKAEWSTVTSYLGGESISGGKMKEIGTRNWITPNTDADNSSGFSGLPCGLRDVTGTFAGKGDSGVWWSSTEGSTYEKHFIFGLLYNSSSIINRAINNGGGFSIRCVKD